MNKNRRSFIGVALSLLLAACAPIQPAARAVPAAPVAPTAPTAPTATPAADTAAPAMKSLKIVASTSWVGAFAKAAGATDITVIAPSNLQHPPDYDPKPSDLVSVAQADYVLMAGFEGFAKRMQEAVGGDAKKLITVNTENSPEAIHKEVARLGELFGTPDKAKAYLAEFDAQYAKLTEQVRVKLNGASPVVVAQAFAVPWVMFAGLKPAGTYGPMPMGPEDLKKLSDLKPNFVFENVHMGGGQPVVEASGATKIDLVNFPGDDLDLFKVFATNAEHIEAAITAAGDTLPKAAANPVANPFAVSVAQFYLDSAGFHGMATAISDTGKLDSAYLTTVSRVNKMLTQTPWPEALHEQAHGFMDALGKFAAALTASDVAAAKEASDVVHDAQHELSHHIDEWLATNPAKAATADPFAVSVAQTLMDTAGFHGMATTISDTGKIDSGYLGKVIRVKKVLVQTTWPEGLNEQAQTFIGDLGKFAEALTANDVATAKETSDVVHDAQHELSHAIDAWVASNPSKAAAPDRFSVSVAQYYLDSAGFHGMATAISDTAKIDSNYLGTVVRVKKILAQVTWPDTLGEPAQGFIGDLGKFADALTASDVAAAKETSDVVHDAQHELSHEIDGWMSDAAAAGSPAVGADAHGHGDHTMAAAGYPVTIENCGRSLTFAKAPERVVGLWQPQNEILLALGLKDHIVAFAGMYAPLPASLEADAKAIPSIGSAMDWPSKEVLFAQKADLVVSELLEGFAFDDKTGHATVADLEQNGTQVYSASACKITDYAGRTMETVFTDIENFGKIFGVQDRASQLLTGLKAKQAEVLAKVKDAKMVKVAFYNGGEGPLNVLSGGVWGNAVTQARGQNVFEVGTFQVSPEAFAAAEPDVIIVGTYPGQEAATSIAYLKKTFPEVPAVKSGRMYPIETIETEASIRIMDGFEKIAKAIHPEAFK